MGALAKETKKRTIIRLGTMTLRSRTRPTAEDESVVAEPK